MLHLVTAGRTFDLRLAAPAAGGEFYPAARCTHWVLHVCRHVRYPTCVMCSACCVVVRYPITQCCLLSQLVSRQYNPTSQCRTQFRARPWTWWLKSWAPAQESSEGESTQCVLAHTSAVPPTSHRDSSVRDWDCSLQLRYLANENTRFARVISFDYPLDLFVQVLC